MKTQKHIALVDDHSLFRSGIGRLLEEFADIVITFEASNGKELQRLLPQWSHSTDVIFMDITMPGMDGYQSTKWVKENYPDVHVIALSMYEDEQAIIKMLRAGAGGYIFKESKPAELYSAIREVMLHGYYSNNQVSGKIIRSLSQNETLSLTDKLTAKEREFLILSATENTYKEIAAKMNVAPRTVDNYRESLFEKLNVKSRVGLVLFAIRNELVKV